MILDTNARPAVAESHPSTARKFATTDRAAIPVIVLGEYRFGILQSRQKGEYERWLEEMVRACWVLEVEEETAGWYAELRVELKGAGTPIPTNDAWIAALCRQHGLVIISRDRHFDLVKGLTRVRW